ELREQLKGLSQREGVTLFMVLLAGFQVLLSRYSGQEDIAVGTPIAGRNRVEIEELIGLFVNTLVLRTRLSGGPTFRDVLKQVREVALGAYANQEIPFEKLVEEMQPERSLSHHPLFQVMFALQNMPQEALKLEGLNPGGFKQENRKPTTFDLTLSLVETGQGIIGNIEYSLDLFDEATIKRMVGNFTTLLEGIITDPQQRVSRLPILTRAEREQLTIEW